MTSHMPAKTLVIVNPQSAGGATGRRWPEIEVRLGARGVPVDVHFTAGPRDATRITREALADGRQTVVGVGGDGTLNEIVNGYFAADGSAVAPTAAIGLIPSGTGGDYRRSLGQLTAASAIDALASGRRRQVDVGRIEAVEGSPHYFVNIAEWGVGGEVVERVNRNRFKGAGVRGAAVFLGVSLGALATYSARPIELTIDGESEHRDLANLVIANGTHFGGGMRVAPRARIDDGRFDVIMVGAMPRARLLMGMARIYRGSHIGMPGIDYRRAKTLTVKPLDNQPLRYEAEGESLGAGGATVTCLERALRFVA